MSDVVILEQKRGSEKYRVELRANEIEYRQKAPRGAGSSTVPFELLSRKTTVYTRSNPFFRNAAIYFGILTVLTVAFGFLIDLETRLAILWAALGVVSYLVFRFTGVEFEIFPLADGRAFRLIRNRPSAQEYADFRATLFARRDAYLLERYARIDIERPAALERKRIDWLHDEGVIDERAYVTIIETIEEHAPSQQS